jgi:23S rRNA (guanine2445-N2)-methyltransferase / 23S rRNA (guanine2069-N7)-methyltransferase
LCAGYAFEKLLQADATIAVDFKGASDFIRNTIFGAQLIKEAIVDRIQRATNVRLRVDLDAPDCLIHARLHHGEFSLFYDLSGHSLHQRGYRKEAGDAPLKENLAAAVLIRAGWPKLMPAPFIDPFCGSGTLLIEAAMMASQKAPGLDRLDYGFVNWQGHDEALWSKLQKDALETHEQAMDDGLALLFGYDQDAQVLETAKRNIRAAGFLENIQLQARTIRDFALPQECDPTTPGLIVANPPYGERLGDSQQLVPLYEELGVAIKRSGWKAAVLTSDPALAGSTRLRSHKQYAFMNGKIPCKLYLFDPHPNR